MLLLCQQEIETAQQALNESIIECKAAEEAARSKQDAVSAKEAALDALVRKAEEEKSISDNEPVSESDSPTELLQQTMKLMESLLHERLDKLEEGLSERLDKLETRSAGYLCFASKALGYSCSEAKTAGYSITEAKTAYSLTEMKTAGYSCSEMKTAGYSCSEAKTAGYSLTELQNAGYLTDNNL